MGNRVRILLRPSVASLCWELPVTAWSRRGEVAVAIAVKSRIALFELSDFLIIATPGLSDSVGNLAVLDQLRIALLFCISVDTHHRC